MLGSRSVQTSELKRAKTEKSACAFPSRPAIFRAFFSIRGPHYLTEMDKREIEMKEYASIKKNQRWELRPIFQIQKCDTGPLP